MTRSNVQLGGQELKLDADADTSITADTDDQIDIKVGGSDRFKFDNSGHASLLTDGASLKFGADSEVILRHGADNGLQLEGSGLNTNFTINAFHATDSTTPDLDLHKSGSSTIGTQAATADSENLGQIRFSGVDTSGSSRNGAVIKAIQDGTSSDSVPALMDLQTNGFTRLRLDKSGRMFVGGNTAEPSNSISGCQLSNPDTLSSPKISVGSSTALRTMIEFMNGNGTVGTIKTTGTTTQFNTSSDYRLKENIVTDWDATTRLKQLKPSRFNFKTNADVTLDGFLAHEVSAIVPEAVSGEKDETQDLGTIKDKDGNVIDENVLETRTKKDDGQTWTKTKTENVYQGIDQSKLVPLLVKTIQELEARIAKLESK